MCTPGFPAATPSTRSALSYHYYYNYSTYYHYYYYYYYYYYTTTTTLPPFLSPPTDSRSSLRLHRAPRRISATAFSFFVDDYFIH